MNDAARLAELDKAYSRIVERATDQLMPSMVKVETAFRNGRGRRRNERMNGGRTVRDEIREEAEAFLLDMAETSVNPELVAFRQIAEERRELRERVNAFAEATFTKGVAREVVKIARQNGGPPKVDDLVGPQEVQALLGVSRARFYQLRDSKRAGFPEPAATVSGTPIWNRNQIVEWNEARKGGKGK
jgi:predicted DNA-binding transcriptional regulator AlpA